MAFFEETSDDDFLHRVHTTQIEIGNLEEGESVKVSPTNALTAVKRLETVDERDDEVDLFEEFALEDLDAPMSQPVDAAKSHIKGTESASCLLPSFDSEFESSDLAEISSGMKKMKAKGEITEKMETIIEQRGEMEDRALDNASEHLPQLKFSIQTQNEQAIDDACKTIQLEVKEDKPSKETTVDDQQADTKDVLHSDNPAHEIQTATSIPQAVETVAFDNQDVLRGNDLATVPQLSNDVKTQLCKEEPTQSGATEDKTALPSSTVPAQPIHTYTNERNKDAGDNGILEDGESKPSGKVSRSKIHGKMQLFQSKWKTSKPSSSLRNTDQRPPWRMTFKDAKQTEQSSQTKKKLGERSFQTNKRSIKATPLKLFGKRQRSKSPVSKRFPKLPKKQDKAIPSRSERQDKNKSAIPIHGSTLLNKKAFVPTASCMMPRCPPKIDGDSVEMGLENTEMKVTGIQLTAEMSMPDASPLVSALSHPTAASQHCRPLPSAGDIVPTVTKDRPNDFTNEDTMPVDDAMIIDQIHSVNELDVQNTENPEDASNTSETRDFSEMMQSIETMLLEAKTMRECLLEARVRQAINSNKLLRLDNPIIMEKLLKLKERVQRVIPTESEPPTSQPVKNSRSQKKLSSYHTFNPFLNSQRQRTVQSPSN